VDVRFVILAKPGTPNRDKFRRLPAVIGRAEDAALRLPADFVSRRHCEILERDGTVFLRDLGSTNGTSIDGEVAPAHAEVPMRSGGTIQIGGYRIRIEFGTSCTTAVATPVGTAAAVPDDRKTVPLADTGAEADSGPAATASASSAPGDFGFLEPPSDEPVGDGDAAWPAPAAEPPDEGDLDSFFKSLS
jgi:predicted component of type VI protein secretion system